MKKIIGLMVITLYYIFAIWVLWGVSYTYGVETGIKAQLNQDKYLYDKCKLGGKL